MKGSTAVSEEIAKDLTAGKKKTIKESPAAAKIPNTKALGDEYINHEPSVLTVGGSDL